MRNVRLVYRVSCRSSRSRVRGFSLVELMVALVLGLIIVGGVISIFLSNQQAARANEGLARLQENARVAFELMARDVRQAGGNLCGATVTANVLNNAAATWWADWDGGVIRGYDETQDTVGIVPFGLGVGQRVAGTHAVAVLSGGMFNGFVVTGHNPTTHVFSLNTPNHDLAAGDVVMVCDGASAAIAQLSAVSSAPIGSLTHAQAGTLNTTTDLGFPLGSPKTFQPGGMVSRYTANFWYVGHNPRGGTSLYRMNRTGVPEEVAESVTGMQAQFLLRNQTSGNLGNDWVTASAVAAWDNAAADLVVAVRLTLDLETTNRVGTDQQPLRRQLFHVVNLRNRPAP